MSDVSRQTPVEAQQAAIEENAKDMGIGTPPQEVDSHSPDTPAPEYKPPALGVGNTSIAAGEWQYRQAQMRGLTWSQQQEQPPAPMIDQFNDKGRSALHQQPDLPAAKPQRDMDADELEAEKLRLIEEYKAEFDRQAQELERGQDHGIEYD